MIVVDSSVVYALLDRADVRHEQVAGWWRSADPHFATTPLILAEVDHLATARAGSAACDAWRRDLVAGAYAVRWWDGAAAEIAALARTYDDLGIGLADASLVALAGRLGTLEIATLDQRHFRVLRPLRGGPAFRLLPDDA